MESKGDKRGRGKGGGIPILERGSTLKTTKEPVSDKFELNFDCLYRSNFDGLPYFSTLDHMAKKFAATCSRLFRSQEHVRDCI